ncbi:MAG: UDP-N-acetylglucosamine 2-epimerase (non-hydrolyzing) [Acidobacteria bacterium]|nr:UDP-N-acetylglucosamine 2-epimerase (non-hydrolyzing) [Acidobacteriota bacterium]
MPKILLILGTRPEAIKLSPVILHFRCHRPEWSTRVCVTAQHRGLLDQVLEVFGIRPDYDLDAMLPGQSLFQSTARMLTALEPVLKQEKPDLVMVQGDTTTTLCGALAGFYGRVPVAHVEAGLRTGDLAQPFPEEMNRVLVSRVASVHCAPTRRAAENLLREGLAPESVAITGNPGIDAVFHVREQLRNGRLRPTVAVDPTRKLILVTAHRRESFGEGFEQICAALAALAARPDVQIAYPVHPNPNVREPVYRHLRGRENVLLLEPLEYISFVDLLSRAWMVLTDSGGIQEEAPSLGKPVLVMRNKTERPEAVQAGTARLVGSQTDTIVAECGRLLDDPEAYQDMSRAHNPYGDGHASPRIAEAVARFFKC